MNLFAPVRDAAWLTADRARAYGRLLAIALALSGAWILINRVHYSGPDRRPIDDFLTFMAAGDMMRSGHAALAYNMDAFTGALSHYAAMGTGRLPFLYPPVMLIVCGWIAHLTEAPAYLMFELVTLIPLLTGLAHVLPRRWAMLPIAAAPAVLMNLGSGQTGFFPASAYAVAAVLIQKRPALAGVALGLLLFKPHFALLVPVALVCAAQWRACFACGATAGALALASLAVCPIQVWVAFFSQQSVARFMLEHGTNILLSVDPFGSLRAAGASVAVAYIAQTVCSAVVLLLVVIAALRRPSGTALIAMVAAGSLLFTPYAMDYDLGVALVPLAWMVSRASQHGWQPWEKIVALLVYLLPLYVRITVITTGVQPASFVLLAFAVLVWRRVMALPHQGFAGMGSGGMKLQVPSRFDAQTLPKQRSGR